MTAVTRAYVPGPYGQIHYRIAAPAAPPCLPPLLCLHQTPGNGGDWDVILPDLARGRIVVAPDTPGYGMSDPPPEPVRIEDFARAMAGVMDRLFAADADAPPVFDVMGYHTGSIIATELARTLPGRVRRLVLFGLAAYEADIRAEKLARLPENFPPPADDLAHVEKLWAIFGRLSDPRMSAEEKHVRMAECLRLGSRMPWAYVAVYRYDFLEAMRAVPQATLIFNPQDDLWEVTRRTSGAFRNGRRYDMPGVRHGALAIEKAAILREIETFLAD